MQREKTSSRHEASEIDNNDDDDGEEEEEMRGKYQVNMK
jgi:hypothetical protein